MPQRATVHYHRHTGTRQAYGIDAHGVQGRIDSPEHVITEVTLHDVRQAQWATRFERDGIVFVPAPGPRPAVEQPDIAAYAERIRTLLHTHIGAEEVHVFDHTVRIDDPTALRRPARNVHTDYSPDAALERLNSLLGPERASVWRAGHFAFINVWRPLSDVVRSAPLGFVRPASVAPADWLHFDLIYADRVGQIMGLVANPQHEWLYQSNMTADEAVVFSVFDNHGLPSVAHSALDLIDGPAPHAIRKSIESRTIVRFAN